MTSISTLYSNVQKAIAYSPDGPITLVDDAITENLPDGIVQMPDFTVFLHLLGITQISLQYADAHWETGDEDERFHITLADSGYWDVYGTVAMNDDFELQVYADTSGNICYELSASIKKMSLLSMQENHLVDKIPSQVLSYLPKIKSVSCSITADSETEDMTMKLSSDVEWDVLNVSILKFHEVYFHLERTHTGETAIDIANDLFVGGTLKFVSTEISPMIRIPFDANDYEWEFTFTKPTLLNDGFEDLAGLVFFYNLNNVIPKSILDPVGDLGTGEAVWLNKLDIKLDSKETQITYLQFEIEVDGNIEVGPFALEGSLVEMTFTPASKGSKLMDIEVHMTQKCAIEGLPPIETTLNIPNLKGTWTIESHMETGIKGKSFQNGQNLLNKCLTLVTGDNTPDLQSTFSMPDEILNQIGKHVFLQHFELVFDEVTKKVTSITVDVTINEGWSIADGYFTFDSSVITFEMSQNPKAKAGNSEPAYIYSASFTENVTIGSSSDSTAFPATFSASYSTGDDIWDFKAEAKNIPVSHIFDAFMNTSGSISGLPSANVKLLEVELKIEPDSKTGKNKKIISGKGELDTAWNPNVGGISFTLDADITASFTKTITSSKQQLLLESGAQLPSQQTKHDYTASISALLELKDFSFLKKLGVTFKVSFPGPHYSATFEHLFATYDIDLHIFSFKFPSITLGDILAKFFHWIDPNLFFTLPSPFDILLSLNLDWLKLDFDLHLKIIGFDFTLPDPFDFGFGKIFGFSLQWHFHIDKLEFQLLGDIFGISIQPWDPRKPQDAPKAPAMGKGTFDLQYLGLGQHVGYSSKAAQNDWTFDQALATLESAFKPPADPETPPVSETSPIVFQENSDWLFATKFEALNTIELGVIFNDPNMYGLLIQLAGKKAKALAGLKFEIIYKKVSPTVGVYSMQLTLPTEMRHLQFGEVSITLPTIGVMIYTNGNFKIDLGFPWNDDFSQSAQLQVFPFMGAGGFYFAYLDPQTATNVPVITDGVFNPVIEFGLGLRVGVGKTIHKGILSAGLSLTVAGIIQGVIGFFTPHPEFPTKANYYWIQGTAQIVGHLFGKISFAIISANIDVTAYARIVATIECYKPIIVDFSAGVSVHVTVSIDCGFFTIHIGFGFSKTISDQVTVGHSSTPPWTLAANQDGHTATPSQYGMVERGTPPIGNFSDYFAAPQAPPSSHTTSGVISMAWNPITRKTKGSIQLHFAPVLTKNDANATYVPMLTIDAPEKGDASAESTSFDQLIEALVIWALNSNTTDNFWIDANPGDADLYEIIKNQTIDKEYLHNIYNYLAEEKDVYLDMTEINTFLQGVFDVTLTYKETKDLKPLHSSVFPMFPMLTLNAKLNDVPQPNFPLDFSSYNKVDSTYQQEITAFFEKLTAGYMSDLEKKNDTPNEYDNVPPLPSQGSISISQMVYQDYFLMLTKAAIGDAISQLESFPHYYQPSETWTSIGSHFGGKTPYEIAYGNRLIPLEPSTALNVNGVVHTTTGDAKETLFKLQQIFGVPATTIMVLNPDATMNGSAILVVDINKEDETGTTEEYHLDGALTFSAILDHVNSMTGSEVQLNNLQELMTRTNLGSIPGLLNPNQPLVMDKPTYAVLSTDTFSKIAASLAHLEFDNVSGTDTAIDLIAKINADVTGLIIPGTKFTFGANEITATSSTTLRMLANATTAQTISGLMTAIQDQENILEPHAKLWLPNFTYVANEHTGGSETLESIASQFNIPLQNLVDNNLTLTKIWPKDTVLTISDVKEIVVSDLLSGLAKSGAYGNNAGMAARFMLHGLRLPEPGQSSEDFSTKSMYALLGQEVPVPTAITHSDQFVIELIKEQTEDWITFKSKLHDWTGELPDPHWTGDLPNSDTVNVLQKELDYQDIQNAISVASTAVSPATSGLKALKNYHEVPKHYNFTHPTLWQYDNVTPFFAGMHVGVQPNIWAIPKHLLEAANDGKLNPPKVDLKIASKPTPTKPVVDTPIEFSQWGLKVPLSISEVPASKNSSGKMMPNTYQVNGTDEGGGLLLERLIKYCNSNDDSSLVESVHLLYKPSSTGTNSGGLQSNGGATQFIVKTNYSTEANPGGGTTMLLGGEQDSSSLNTAPLQFVELVWEATTVKSGGFYLYYGSGSKHSGLPAKLFDGGTADLQLLITFDPAEDNSQFVQNFYNCLITGDSFNKQNSSVFAESAKNALTQGFGSGISLQDVAGRYRITVDELAEAAKHQKLTSKAILNIGSLQYEVPSGPPVAFGTVITDIIAAYQIDASEQSSFTTNLKGLYPTWTDATTINQYTLINVPTFNYTVGTSQPSCNTLSELATAFGTSVDQLANANATVNNLFFNIAVPFNEQDIMRIPTMKPGNLGFTLERNAPPLQTANESIEDYLEGLFNFVTFNVAGNEHFEQSGIGKSIGSTSTEDKPDDWNYTKVFAIAPFATDNDMTNTATPLPLIENNPYRGIGHTAQIELEWADIFGFTSEAAPTVPGANGTSLKYLPLKVRYTDALLGIGQWPNTACSFNYSGTPAIAGSPSTGQTNLNLYFNFDISKYAVYEPVYGSDPAEPGVKHSPTLNDEKKANMITALKHAHTDLQAFKNIYYQLWQDDVEFQVIETLSDTNVPTKIAEAHEDTIRDFIDSVYEYLDSLVESNLNYTYYEVTTDDLVGNEFENAQHIATKHSVDVNDLIAINKGLTDPFDISTNQDDQFKIIIPNIPAPGPIKVSVPTTDKQQSAVFELDVQFGIARDANLVDPHFADVAGVQSVFTPIHPLKESVYDVMNEFDKSKDIGNKQLSLKAFAKDFETAFSDYDAITNKGTNYKIATGLSYHDTLSSTSKKNLFVVRFHEYGIEYDIKPKHAFYSPTPLSTSLLNFTGSNAVKVKSFDPKHGLVNPKAKNYTGINLDNWAQQCLAAIDEFLLPQFAVPAQIIDKSSYDTGGQDYLEQILLAKEKLASAISSTYLTDPTDSRFLNILVDTINIDSIDKASEKFRQELLVKLMNAYNIDAIVQFDATASISQPAGGATKANLFGQPSAADSTGTQGTSYSMSSAEIPLNDASSDLTFAFSTKQAAKHKDFVLDLEFQVTHIEYDIQTVKVKGEDGRDMSYEAGTWLNFVTPMDPEHIAMVDIPIPLRTYPTPPSLASQKAVPNDVYSTSDEKELKDILEWSYQYTYSQMEAAQDEIITKIQFNINPADTKSKTTITELPKREKLFGDLAQFIEVYPDLQRVFVTDLAKITPASSAKDMENACAAIEAFASVIGNISDSWQDWQAPKDSVITVDDATLEYSFKIQELKHNKDIKVYEHDHSHLSAHDQDEDILMIEVTPWGSGDDTGIQMPSIHIEGFETVQVQGRDNCYIFKAEHTSYGYGYLLHSDRSNYRERTVNFEEANILSHQNAWGAVAELRNYDLVDGQETTPEFIYQTPYVRASTIMVPFIDTINDTHVKPINIANLTNTYSNPDNLASLIGNMLKTIYGDYTGSQEIKLVVNYSYALANSIRVDIPVVLVPPMNLSIPTDCNPTNTDSFASHIATDIIAWVANNKPSKADAQIDFDLSIYSSLNHTKLPLARIRDLYAPVASIADLPANT